MSKFKVGDTFIYHIFNRDIYIESIILIDDDIIILKIIKVIELGLHFYLNDTTGMIESNLQLDIDNGYMRYITDLEKIKYL